MLSRCRERQLKRTLLLIAILRANGGCSLERLAAECNVSTRTIRRDLQTLQEAGLPVYSEEHEWGAGHSSGVRFWRFVKGSPCPICNRGMVTGKEYREQRREMPIGSRAVDPVPQRG